jgi:hypothetical protein
MDSPAVSSPIVSSASSLISFSSRLSSVERHVYLSPSSSSDSSFPSFQFPSLPAFLQPQPEKRSSLNLGSSSGSFLSRLPSSGASSVDSTLTTYLAKFDEVNTALTRVEDEFMREFFQKFTLFESLINKKSDLATHQINVETKSVLILAAEEELKALAKQLEEIQSLQKEMDKTIQVPGSLETFNQLLSVEYEKSLVMLANARELHQQTEQFISFYDRWCDFISKKFVELDVKLTKLAVRMENYKKKKGK